MLNLEMAASTLVEMLFREILSHLRARFVGSGPTGATEYLDHPSIGKSLFFPRECDPEGASFIDCGQVRLSCYRCEIHPEAGWLIHFHGNGELAADYALGQSSALFGLGVNLCFAEYRGYGASTGVPTLRSLIDDCEFHLQALGVPANRLVAYGRSLGSLAAIELASRHRDLAGLILESGVADLLERLRVRVDLASLGIPPAALADDVARHFHNRAKLQAYPGPMLVMHTENDGMIDPRHAQNLLAWGGGAEKELILFPLGNHNTILQFNRVDYRRAVRSFLDRLGLTA
jgi:pimeloyl-ACP methyl ester carboxylesterase